jgi:E3 ubiquitin-protein ligase DOA10
MKIFRIIALAVILLAAVVSAIVTINAKPTNTASSSVSAANMSREDYSSLILAALRDYDSNASTTENVYQQQVVAAWAAKDLLGVIGQQNATIIDNQVAAADAQSFNQAMALAAQQRTQGLISGVMVVGVLLLAALVVIGFTLIDRRPAAAPSQSSLAPTMDSGTPAATPNGPATSDAGEQGGIA